MIPTHLKYDDVAWEKSDAVYDLWLERMLDYGREMGDLIHKYHGGPPVTLKGPQGGSFNVCFRLEFLNGACGLIRYPAAGRVMLPEEKLRAEVAAMRFIASHTLIPVPLVLHTCFDGSECTTGLGPFMIMEYVKHDHALGDVIEQPGRRHEERPYLDENIDHDKLFRCYKKMAVILFQLSRPALDKIGSLAEIAEDEHSVTQRPLSQNMNDLLQLGDLPFDRLPTTTFSTASSYYIALADMHLEHLLAQHNDAVDSEQDCRRKYVARHLFCKLAAEKRLDHFPEFEHGPFRLFCEDLRPGSVLVTKDTDFVAGVIDWEFTISAPAGFSYSPPWWLLLEHPVKWSQGLDDWETKYAKRLETFLDALREVEQEAVQKGLIANDRGNLLSDRMSKSWNDGAFWVEYATQRSWAFDPIFFLRLDEKFFGKIPDGMDWLSCRLPLLREDQREGMEPFVRLKMGQRANPKLVDERFDAFPELPLLEDD